MSHSSLPINIIPCDKSWVRPSFPTSTHESFPFVLMSMDEVLFFQLSEMFYRH
ncbi:hypothetical protein X975_16389, partial [Stegodyphus mimosarum]